MTRESDMVEEAARVLERLEKAGYAAFFVGGFVRDRVGGREVHDIDLASSAPPEEALALFPGALPTGLKHGTITVRQGGHSFELTTFRKESEYEDFRRPSGVEYVSEVEEDLRRRDFTINAMAMTRHGELIDPFDGAGDLRRGILRAVGDPDLRFREDALRMMRCVRFAANYGLSIDRDTWLALIANARLLRHIAMERVRSELERIVEGPHPADGLRLLADSRLLRYTKERLGSPLADWTAADLAEPLGRLGSLQPAIRWTVLALALRLPPQETERLWRVLTFPVKEGKRVSSVLALDAYLLREWEGGLASDAEEQACAFRKGALLFGADAASEWLAAARHWTAGGLRLWQEPELASTERRLIEEGERLLREMPVKRIDELAVGGEDLLAALDQKGGPWLGKTMRRLAEEAACGRLPNERTALLARAVELAARD